MRRFMLNIIALALLAAVTAPRAEAQVVATAVGGVSIDAQGQINALTQQQRTTLANRLREQLAVAPGDLQNGVPLRMVSLSGLQAALQAALDRDEPIPADARYLAGLQRVQYVFLYPEQNDIVLAGPAEGWKVGPTGDIVGVTTGMPVLQLDDLIVALRSVRAAAEVGISCSIDPTAEGRQALDAFLRTVKRFSPNVTSAIEKVMGPQEITITGVPAESHFAQILVASDFRMKRLAMNLETSPVEDMPGFLELIRTRRGGLNNMMPRWWMACDYEAIARSEDGLSWQLRGPGVKVMTEDEIVAADGSVAGSGNVNPVAQEWANSMTSHYGELARHEPVFAQLRNLMDLCVIAALIDKEGLLAKADCELPLLYASDSRLTTQSWGVPKTVATQSSFVKKGREYIVTASGGVLVDSWSVAAQTEVVPALTTVRPIRADESLPGWRWN